MASLDVISVGGAKSKKAGSLELDPTVFEAEVRSDLLHAEVRRQLAALLGVSKLTRLRVLRSFLCDPVSS